ncbi:nuclear transcription factor Y subunit B-10-like [Oryza glaberrima]|uniref:Transcription factor CBF/NF-Y/archaeal histone domain-containing protein n=1 Tax=Oryza glaberrima TaxID=4538 RepID=I1Q5I3_ORYGL|nr:nuclear transcription factor Y subunit B-10-like [Oryza glaberrima]
MEPAFPNGGAAAPPPPMAAEQPAAAAAVVREQDRLMPIANVIRIMRRVLPPHAKISDDAKEVIQECVSEFISFVTGEANDRCHREHRKTVTAEDLVWAMDRLGFDDYVPPLTAYLRRTREYEGGGSGGGGGGGRGAAAAPAVVPPPPPPPPEDAFRYVQVHHPVYAAPGEPVQGYGYPVAMSSALPAPHVHVGVRGGGQHEVFGGGPAPLAVYYGGALYGEASSRGGCSAADEGSSSSSASPAPVGPNYE